MNLHDTEARDALVRYVFGDLPREEAEEIDRRLAVDPALAAEVASLRRTLDLLPYATVLKPPRHLRDRILKAAGETARGPAPVRRRAWRWSLAALAASLLLALGLDDLRLRRELELQRELAQTLQQPNVVLSFEIQGTGTAARAFGSVALDLDAQKGAVVLRGLPTLPEGRVYRLWAELRDRKVPCGEFRTDPQGRVVRQFAIPVSAYTSPIQRLILTREPTSISPSPTGPVVMRSS